MALFLHDMRLMGGEQESTVEKTLARRAAVRCVQWARLATARPRLAVSGFCLAGAAALFWSPPLQFDFGLGPLVPRGDAEFRRYRALGEWFGRDDNQVAVFMEDPELFTEKGAQRVARMSEEFASSDWVERVASLATVPWVDRRGREIWTAPPFHEKRRATADFQSLRRSLLQEPIFRGRLLSPDGTTTSLLLRLSDEAHQDRHRSEVLGDIESVIETYRGAGRRFWVTGNAPTRQSYLELLLKDLALLLPLTVFLLAVTLYVTFRHWVGVLVPLLVVGLSQVVTATLWAYSGLPVTLLSVSVPVVLTVVGSSDAIHGLTRFAQECACGRSKAAALLRTLERTLPAMLVTSATTAAGFLVLALTGIPLLQDFGILVALGTMIAFLTTALVMPPLALALPVPPPPLQGGARFFSVLSNWIGSRYKWLTVATLVLVALAVSSASRLRVESRIIDDVSAKHPIAIERRDVSQRMGGTFPMTLLVQADRAEARAAIRPEFLTKVAAFETALRHQPDTAFSSAVSIVDVYRMMWRGMEREGELPATERQVSQLNRKLSGEILQDSLLPGASTLRIDVWVHDRGTRQMNAFLATARALFAETVGRDGRLEVQGFAYLAHKVHREVVLNAVQGFLLSLFAVGLLLLWMFPSPSEVLLATVTNAIPPALTLGFMGLADIQLRIASVIVFSIVFGVAVDDTVHFLARYREERSLGSSPSAAVARTVEGVGVALTTTSIVLALGFLVLILGQFRPSQELGLLMAVTTLTALACDLIVLPAMLLWKHELDARSRTSD